MCTAGIAECKDASDVYSTAIAVGTVYVHARAFRGTYLAKCLVSGLGSICGGGSQRLGLGDDPQIAVLECHRSRRVEIEELDGDTVCRSPLVSRVNKTDLPVEFWRLLQAVHYDRVAGLYQ